VIKIVVFDWNGTLFADTIACWRASSSVVKNLGGRTFSLEEFRKTFDVPIVNFYRKHGVDSCDPDGFLRFYLPSAKKCRTRRGAKRVLAFLAKRNISAAILSNHIRSDIREQLVRLKIDGMFSVVLGNDSLFGVAVSRSKMERLTIYLKSQRINPSELILVGDTLEEPEIGRKIGAVTVAITGGYCSAARLKSAKPDYLISNLLEIKSIIENLQ